MFSISHTRFPAAAILTLALVFAALPVPASANPPGNPENSEICRDAIRQTEASFDLPLGILQAISLAESGRWDKETRSKFAWPWTVTARGKGEFYPSREHAIAAVQRLKREGVRNIDVGCMQINLLYHPEAFDSLDEAFDPDANTRYAADLFSRLRESTRSISRAIAHYHSTTREYNVPYTKKVLDLWNEERRRFYEEERQRKIAEWKEKRARWEKERAQARAGESQTRSR